jgi:glycine cleavage system H protein
MDHRGWRHRHRRHHPPCADPSLANSDPLAAGWFFKVRLSQPSQLDALLDKTAYDAFSANA